MGFKSLGLTAGTCLQALLAQCDETTGTDWIPLVSRNLARVALVRGEAEFCVVSDSGYRFAFGFRKPGGSGHMVYCSVPIALGPERLLETAARQFLSFARSGRDAAPPEPEPQSMPHEHMHSLVCLQEVAQEFRLRDTRYDNSRHLYRFTIGTFRFAIDVDREGTVEAETTVQMGPSVLRLIDMLCGAARTAPAE